MAHHNTQPPRQTDKTSIQARVLQRLANEERDLQSRDRPVYRGDMPGGLIYVKSTGARGRQFRTA
jgi:hypothetical protein